MLLTDYFRYPKDATWDIAKQSGVSHGVIRLPETGDFDLTDKSHWQTVYDGFMDYGLKPVIIEPMPNELHDHIKAGDEKRDECIEKAIKMFPIMDALDIRCICFNFMAHIGWFRTKNDIEERGGARVTGFDINDFTPVEAKITKDELWSNYEYFIKAVLPYAEKHNINLALHPDDPPRDLGGVERIMTSADNIDRAINGIVKSPNLGITMCQATYHIMGEKLEDVIPRFKDKIMFVHFRNTRGNINAYRETYHDNGEIDMAEVMKIYRKCGVDVPIRVDHVPTMVGEDMKNQGYDAIGRYFAIGYLKGILDATK
ncbi:MAG: mannonate dehydratase [Oscillospiraceae bacterium]|nr:mannonate dehydratase [Oscillospiraceae bacterium]MBQ7120260.1 mannonate dehydratase [Oscillospiraceae bacterium]